MATWTNQTKNTASWSKQERKGVAPAGTFGQAEFDSSQFDTEETQVTQDWNYQSKNTASWSKQGRKGAAPAGTFGQAEFDSSQFDTEETQVTQKWTNYIRRGKSDTISDLEDRSFDELALLNGDTLGEASFDELAPTEWTNQTKN